MEDERWKVTAAERWWEWSRGSKGVAVSGEEEPSGREVSETEETVAVCVCVCLEVTPNSSRES